MQQTFNFTNETRANLKSQEVAIGNLETQLHQFTSSLNLRPYGSLPCDTVSNMRKDGKKKCKAITLRSGKPLEPSLKEDKKKEEEVLSPPSQEELVEDDTLNLEPSVQKNEKVVAKEDVSPLRRKTKVD